MKKVLALVIVIVALFTSSAFTEIDLSSMTFEELVKLQNEINAALWASDEWQSVKVPAGVYKIGLEIPAGKWVVRPVDGQTGIIKVGVNLRENKMDVDYPYWSEQITSPTDSYAKYNKIEEVVVTLESGYVIIESCPMIFEPYSAPTFFFK